MSLDQPMKEDAGKSGEYVVVARRYRPQAFGELVGQGMVSQALKNAINSDRVGHAYLFTGARGVGKTSTARIFAKALNCVNGPTPDPCGECDVCQGVTHGDDVDVLEIDGASNRGIDEIRQLRSNVGIRPSRSRFKVYIIDEVHMLTKEAFNALLKTLEEPPEHVKFIFCTTEPGKIPITVLSRCQRFDFSPVESDEIAERLRFIVQAEGANAEPEALELLARRAAGSMRDSQSLLEQLLSFVGDKITVEDVHSMFGTAKTERVTAVVERLIARDASGSLNELQTTLQQGVDSGQLAEQLLTSLRDILACAVGCDPNLLLFHSPSDFERLKVHGKQWGVASLLAAIQILDQTVTRMRLSVHSRILLEIALVRIAKLEDLDELSDVISKLASGEKVELRSGLKKKDVTPADSEPSSLQSIRNQNLVASRKDDIELPTHTSQSSSFNTAQEGEEKTDESADHQTVELEATSTTVQDHTSTAQTEAVGTSLAEPPPRADGSMNVPTSTTPPADPESEKGEALATLPTEEPAALDPNPTRDDSHSLEAKGVESDSTTKLVFKEENARKIWKSAIDQLSDLTADFANQASRIAISAPNQLAVHFLSRYNSGRVYCERPERRQKIEKAVSKVVDQPIKVEFFTITEDRAHEMPRRPMMSSQQLKREITTHPLVEFAAELFEAQVTKVDLKK